MDSVFMISVLKALLVAPASGWCGLRIAIFVQNIWTIRSDASRVVWGVHPMSSEGSESLSEAFSRLNCVKISRRSQSQPSQAQRIRNDRNGTQAHRRSSEHGTEQEAEERIEQPGGDGDAEGVVGEGEEEIETDVMHSPTAQADAGNRSWAITSAIVLSALIECGCSLRPFARSHFRLKDGRAQTDRTSFGSSNRGNIPWPAQAQGACRFPRWESDGDGRAAKNKWFKRSYQSFVRSFGNYFWQTVYTARTGA